MQSCLESSSLENWPIAFTVRHLIPILVLISGLRSFPRAESVEKQLLAKWMAYTQSLDLSLFQNMNVNIESAIGPGRIIAVMVRFMCSKGLFRAQFALNSSGSHFKTLATSTSVN